jgi:hypothetical protein
MSAATFVGALLGRRGDCAQTLDFLLEGLFRNRASVDDSAVSEAPHQSAVSLAGLGWSSRLSLSGHCFT